MLTAKGLVAARPGLGTWVQPEEAWNVLDPDVLRWLMQRGEYSLVLDDLNQLRLAMEPHAAALAARVLSGERLGALRTAIGALDDRALADWRCATDQANALKDAYRRLETAVSEDGDVGRADMEFHREVMRASGNRFLTLLGGVIEVVLLENEVAGRRAALPCTTSIGHKNVLNAILEGNPELARSSMAQLLDAMARRNSHN